MYTFRDLSAFHGSDPHLMPSGTTDALTRQPPASASLQASSWRPGNFAVPRYVQEADRRVSRV